MLMALGNDSQPKPAAPAPWQGGKVVIGESFLAMQFLFVGRILSSHLQFPAVHIDGTCIIRTTIELQSQRLSSPCFVA
jgi:hypothetical protein